MFKDYAKYYDKINADKKYEQECKFIFKWANKPKSILDLGCGTASYWKYYPEGIFILGIEKSKEMRELSEHKNLILLGDITKVKMEMKFDCVTALFDVINYIPRHNWWGNIPVKKGGYFIFDIWNKDKVNKDGFKVTKKHNKTTVPSRKGNKVILNLFSPEYSELHTMYLYSEEDIVKFCGKNFKIVDKKETSTWQTWYKLERIK